MRLQTAISKFMFVPIHELMWFKLIDNIFDWTTLFCLDDITYALTCLHKILNLNNKLKNNNLSISFAASVYICILQTHKMCRKTSSSIDNCSPWDPDHRSFFNINLNLISSVMQSGRNPINIESEHILKFN